MKPYEKQCALSGTDTIFVRIYMYVAERSLWYIFAVSQ